MNPEQFSEALADNGIVLNKTQKEQFAIYHKTLVQWNEKINLTSLTQESDIYLKHFYDSVTAALYTDFSGNPQVCDVGAGAGFPSLPLKICFPDIRITIVDSLQKRIGFLNHLVQAVGLSDVSLYHDRAETFGQDKRFRGQFDIVTARAVARMSVLTELCLPLVKKDGVFLAMKGSQGQVELEEASKAINVLGGSVRKTHLFHLPNEQSERTIIVIDKKRQSSQKYPRKPGTPNKFPI